MLLTLPLDVIHYHLFPYLDYTSRTSVNCILPMSERKHRRLKEGAVREFSVIFSQAMLARLARTLRTGNPKEILTAYRSFQKHHLTAVWYSKYSRVLLRDSVTSVLERLENRDINHSYEWLLPRKGALRKELMACMQELVEHTSDATLQAHSHPPIVFQRKYSAVIGCTPHSVMKLPPLCPFERLDREMNSQLERGRMMMAAWRARGDFL